MRLSALVLAGIAAAAVVWVAGPAVEAGARHRLRDRALARRLVRDLDLRGVQFDRDGTPEPLGGMTQDGTCPDGRRARQVALEVPPADSADMYTVTGFVCGSRYWAQRTGGLRAQVLWVGPFVWRPRAAGPRPR